MKAKPPPKQDPARLKGIVCPACGCKHFEVVYTRATPVGTIRRRRQCRHCRRRITTTEAIGVR
ncbi:MAG: hypothetical protein RL689_1593 [Planctomycetota bacterium]|jgi:transcriptional regulator NrdR family protein